LWIAKINLHISSDREVLVFRHLQSAIPRQRAFQRGGELANMPAQGGDYNFRFFAPHPDQHGEA